MTGPPLLFYDLGSPYAYLAVERAAHVLGAPPDLRPVLLGAIFAARGHGSWSATPQRDAGMAEVERRAAAYGLPPLRWPGDWPPNTLAAMRAAVWADREDAARPSPAPRSGTRSPKGRTSPTPASSRTSPLRSGSTDRRSPARSRRATSRTTCARGPRPRSTSASAASRPSRSATACSTATTASTKRQDFVAPERRRPSRAS